MPPASTSPVSKSCWISCVEPSASTSRLGSIASTPGAAAFGLLVLASPDASRYPDDMATDYLERIGEIASAALSRLLVPTSLLPSSVPSVAAASGGDTGVITSKTGSIEEADSQ